MRGRIFSILVGGLLLAASLSAQVVTVGHKFVWEETGSDLATVQGYVYRYAEGSQKGDLVGVVCEGQTSPFTCKVPIPAFVEGSHSVVISAVNPAGESAPSNAVTFTFTLIPATPTNARIE